MRFIQARAGMIPDAFLSKESLDLEGTRSPFSKHNCRPPKQNSLHGAAGREFFG
jgi:hypothetical protein